MSETKWTPEPWCVVRDPSHFHSLSSIIGGDPERSVAEVTGLDVREQEANALRAVHCVNACTGIPDPAAFPLLVPTPTNARTTGSSTSAASPPSPSTAALTASVSSSRVAAPPATTNASSSVPSPSNPGPPP